MVSLESNHFALKTLRKASRSFEVDDKFDVTFTLVNTLWPKFWYSEICPVICPKKCDGFCINFVLTFEVVCLLLSKMVGSFQRRKYKLNHPWSWVFNAPFDPKLLEKDLNLMCSYICQYQ